MRYAHVSWNGFHEKFSEPRSLEFQKDGILLKTENGAYKFPLTAQIRTEGEEEHV